MRSIMKYRAYVLAFICLCLCSLSAKAQDIRITRAADKSYPDQYMAKIEFISACDKLEFSENTGVDVSSPNMLNG